MKVASDRQLVGLEAPSSPRRISSTNLSGGIESRTGPRRKSFPQPAKALTKATATYNSALGTFGASRGCYRVRITSLAAMVLRYWPRHLAEQQGISR